MSLRTEKRRVHFIGIGGIGMSGIAELLLKLGHQVSGSDQAEGSVVRRLRELGAQLWIGHDAQPLAAANPDVVVYSSAVNPRNPELLWAQERRVPVIKRAEMLGELMRLKRSIAIAGSHGKTTTTGIVSVVLRNAGLDPTVVIGGRLDAIGSNATWGDGDWLVAESDESDGSFLRLSPELAVLTNVDPEHLDHYGSFEALMQAVEDFIDRLPFYGRAILCSDCPNLRSLEPRLNKSRVWYGFEEKHKPDYLLREAAQGPYPDFELFSKRDGYKAPLLRARLQVPGRHNALNSAAAALVALELGVSPEAITRGLQAFCGVDRRFQKRGEWRGHPLIEDYAHHPTEIRATLEAARAVFAQQPIFALFQPHRYTRTRDQWKEFGSCFALAHKVWTLPIYAASEPQEAWTKEIDGEHFAKQVGKQGIFCKDLPAAVAALEKAEADGLLPAGAPLLVLGAGNVNRAIELLSGT